MSEFDGAVLFKEWLPDQPELNNPGLIEALNVIPVAGTYKSFAPLQTSGNALPQRPLGAFMGNANAPSGSRHDLYAAYVATAISFSRFDSSALSWTTLGELSTTGALGIYDDISFAQFDDIVLSTSVAFSPRQHTLGAASAFTALRLSGDTIAPAARIGVVNRFVVIGTVVGVAPAYVRWSAIDDITNWPTPNSATAIATQSGEQYLDDFYGEVTGIASGDQYGLIFQVNAITRMTYVGGSVVFQFDKIDRVHGAMYPKSIVRVGSLVYFASVDGFYVTDGVSVKPIGKNKIDAYFRSKIKTTSGTSTARFQMAGVYDYINDLIIWAIPTSTSTDFRPNELLIYSPSDDRWTHANQDCLFPVQIGPSAYGDSGEQTMTSSSAVYAFDSSYKVGQFSGTPGTAIFTTSETELNPGGRALVQGVKPLVDVTANALTVAVGARNDRTSAVNYTSEVTANSRSGFCNFRSDARYHRARLTIAGTFNAAQGLEYEAVPSGYI